MFDLLRVSPFLKQHLVTYTHHRSAPALRRAVVGEEVMAELEHPTTPDATPRDASIRKVAQQIFHSGRCGISQGKEENVKCLHYHLADMFLRHPPALGNSDPMPDCFPAAQTDDVAPEELMRSNPVNVIGQMTYNDLVASGFEIDGTEECWRTCTPEET
jgi:hypothetical protein